MKHDGLGLLAHIEYPEDLRKLPVEELPEVCAELRRDILDEQGGNPGGGWESSPSLRSYANGSKCCYG